MYTFDKSYGSVTPASKRDMAAMICFICLVKNLVMAMLLFDEVSPACLLDSSEVGQAERKNDMITAYFI
jgi:hypothetical protein